LILLRFHRITENCENEVVEEKILKFIFQSPLACSTDSIESNQEGGAMLIESTSNADGYIPNSSLFGPWADSPTQVKILKVQYFRENKKNSCVFAVVKNYLGMFINFTGL
jgi:hypothetical protein